MQIIWGIGTAVSFLAGYGGWLLLGVAACVQSGAALFHDKRTKSRIAPHPGDRRVFQVLGVLAVAPPAALFAGLLAMQWRARTLIGYWPRANMDDPKWIGENDAFYNRVYDLVDGFLLPAAGWGLLLFVALLAVHGRELTPWRRVVVIGAGALTWSLLTWTSVLAWYLD